VFLIGGPAFSGTTLLALLLNRGGVVCLDEPDFHNPAQSHRGTPFLRELFPDRSFPPAPTRRLSWEEATDLVEECEAAIRPRQLGIKTCDRPFVGHAEVYRRRGYPVVCIVRDIRDALVRDLPDWLTEERLNERYRLIWNRTEIADLVIRYEDLVSDPENVLARVFRALGETSLPRLEWTPEEVHHPMLKLDRHTLLRTGRISSERIGIWRTSGRSFTAETHETARTMGYR
jgi:hypothetical protein